MRRCLALARRARGRTSPNPMVGCVIVDRRGRLLAEGWHRGPGTLHAEADALAKLGGAARGATIYCNLEPCHHRDGGRTPCSARVIDSGAARLVLGARDPMPGHGGGAKAIARAGIAVTADILGDACRDANAPFLTWAAHGRPRFALKAAMTLDGKIAAVSGESQWITGAAARADGHAQRAIVDAIVVGVGTVLADDPRLTARGRRGARDPIRVIVDSRLRTPPTAKVLPAIGGSAARTIIATTARAPAIRERRLVAAGAEVWRLPAQGGRVSLDALAARLGAAKILDALVEGGGELHAGFLAAGLADELRVYVAPMVIGGGARAWVGGGGAQTLADASRFAWVGAPRRLGDDWLLIARPRS
ncbi:MAG: bifunctional diaminohydroxyphosphoribosylaminopyrimidine deaminase/5-amino-6-(5-phosphoribosylamino)uracil reductase RibD [Deltaproteobacteria bacterium]|nr:bifunctional diaminohydroxyphosphoribosylaminopyrimidine deaminase/5-amino-6-(5-phosphoribosylamino)uracil reductase RibD [Deltaproteobacteria bacterium]